MGRPPSDLDDYLDWQERLENYKASGLEVSVFCLQEGFSPTTFYKWAGRLKAGIPESMIAEKAARERAESAEGAVFVPISLKASPVEIEFPNGGMVRLPLGVGQTVLVEVIRAVGALRPGRDQSHDELFRRANLLMHDAHEYALQLRSFDGPSAGGL